MEEGLVCSTARCFGSSPLLKTEREAVAGACELGVIACVS